MMPASLTGFTIYTSKFLGDTITPEPPDMPRGPYHQRRIKRWCRKHPSYTVGNGKYLVSGCDIYCHPDDYEALKAATRK